MMSTTTTLTMFETCCTMDQWQQIGYFTYKARLRQDINDDWIDIDHDIWVSLNNRFFYFFSPLSLLSTCLEGLDLNTCFRVIEKFIRLEFIFFSFVVNHVLLPVFICS